MARIRTFKPEFWTDTKTGTLPEYAKCLMLGLLNHADDYGIIPVVLQEWKAKIFPYHSDPTTTPLQESLDEFLVPRGLVSLFNVVDQDGISKAYLFITNFVKHQVINKPSRSLIKDWLKGDSPETFFVRHPERSSHTTTAPLRDGSRASHVALPPERKGMEGNGRERTSPPPSTTVVDLAQATRIIAIFDAERSRIFGPELARPFPVSADIVHAQRWVEAGISEPIARATFAGILDRRKIDGLDPIENLAYFDKPIREALSTPKSTANGHANGAPSETILSTPEPWPQRVAAWAKNRIWKSEWRYPPDDPRCEAPRELVAQYQRSQEPERAGRAS